MGKSNENKKELEDSSQSSKDLLLINSKKGRYRKEKPWDTPDIDKWKIEEFLPEHNKYGMLEESSFATLFPAYREKYIQSIWGEIKSELSKHHIKAELDLREGSMTVRTTRKTYDPYIIIKARDMIKLIARSVPIHQARKILEDGIFCDIIKIGGCVRNKERFVRRRARLVGPNGSTLKAIELLTNSYLLLQGQTVAVMGSCKAIKQVNRIVEDCMRNIHPVYHIKELMIRRELEKDETLKNENWSRFLPQFKKRNVQRKKHIVKKKKSSLFPPDPTPRKEDILLETGEYFIQQLQNNKKKNSELENRTTVFEETKHKRKMNFVDSEHHNSFKRKKMADDTIGRTM